MSISFVQPSVTDKGVFASRTEDDEFVDFDDLLVSQSIDPADLRHLLETLEHEDCAHSWKNFGPMGTLDALHRWENERRPTQLFFFHARRGDKRSLVAASAVADRLIGDFPYSGFCVLGRCYIMPEFRGKGFYRRILKFRLEYCRSRLGGGLNCIHIGTDNERICRTLTTHRLPGWSSFVHLGDQALPVGNKVKMVQAYLLLVAAYVDRIRDALASADAPACVMELRDVLGRIESGGVRNLGTLIKQVSAATHEHDWFGGRDYREVERLALFCSSIPLVGF